MIEKFNLTPEQKKNLTEWEILVAETYDKIYDQEMELLENK